MPDVGCLPLVNLVGSERVLITRFDSRGNIDPQEYYVTLSQIANSGDASAITHGGNVTRLRPIAPDLELDLAGTSGGVLIYTNDEGAGDGTGLVSLASGDVWSGGTSGGASVSTGANSAGDSGSLTIQTGTATSGTAGVIHLETGGGNTSGRIDLLTGNAASGDSGNINLTTGLSAADTGSISLATADAAVGSSGNITLAIGNGTTSKGHIITPGLPIADPHVVGAWWVDVVGGRVLKVSNG